MKRSLFLVILILFCGMTAYAANGDLEVQGNLEVKGSLQFLDGSIQTTAALLPSGMISMYGGATAPTGWLLADGSAVSRTTYAALFAAIGTTYGAGDGSTTFNLPDFRGVFPKGAGSQTIGGIPYSGTLGTKNTDRMQGHKHASGWYGPRSAAGTALVFATNDSSYPSVSTGNPISDGANGTPRTGNTTEPQSLGINFIIKY